MSDVKWIKICVDIFDDEKILLIENLSKADSILVIWFKLLCLAGKQNNSGVFTIQNGIPYTEKMLATVFRRKQSLVKLALKTFVELGMVEIVNNAVTIPNWGKHQNFDQLEAKKNYMRKYMSDYREKQKKLTCKTNSNANCKADVSSADKEIDIEEDKEKEIYKEKERAAVADNNINNIPEHEKTAANTSAATAVLHVYEKNIGLVTPAVIEGIEFFIGEGMESGLVTRIIEYACEQGKRTWQYINAALMGNLNEGVKTLDAYNRAQAERAERKENKTAPGKDNTQTKNGKSKFNNYTDTNKLALTSDQIIADMLAEAEGGSE